VRDHLAIALDLHLRSVRAAAIDHDVLDVLVVLHHHAAERLVDVIDGVVTDGDDGDFQRCTDQRMWGRGDERMC